MPVFAVIGATPEPKLAAAVQARFPDDFIEMAPGQFLVADDKATTADISDALGAMNGGVGRVFVMPVTNYAGWHSKDLWEWLAARMGSTKAPGTSGSG